jgi:hypothetical protein
MKALRPSSDEKKSKTCFSVRPFGICGALPECLVIPVSKQSSEFMVDLEEPLNGLPPTSSSKLFASSSTIDNRNLANWTELLALRALY